MMSRVAKQLFVALLVLIKLLTWLSAMLSLHRSQQRLYWQDKLQDPSTGLTSPVGEPESETSSYCDVLGRQQFSSKQQHSITPSEMTPDF